LIRFAAFSGQKKDRLRYQPVLTAISDITTKGGMC
jgi:hypothetical protein